MGLLGVHARSDRDRAAVREAVRHLRAAPALPPRDRPLLHGVDHLRPLCLDGDAHRRPRHPGARSRRPYPARRRGDRRHHPAAVAWKMAGRHGRGLRRVLRARACGRRLADRQRLLALVLLRQPAARRGRARRRLVRVRAPAGAREAHDRLRRRTLARDRRRRGSPWRSLGRDAVPVELSDHHRPLPRRHRALDRLRPLGAADGGAHPSARPLRGEDVRGRHRRLVLGRSGDVRRDHLRAALRPARARRERVVLGRRAHPAHARDHHDEHRRRADRLPDRPLPTPC